jgi:hypothetical protein
MSFLDPITAGGPANALLTTADPVDVSAATPPNPGDVLRAVDATHATWQPGGGGGTGGDASGLETTGAPVDVSAAAPPVEGQVLMAVDAEHAEWRVPGLHYDPSIKFWTSSAGSATIAPGTWGFIEQAPGAVDPITVYIVSSLEAPPVDSRFGLYVGRDVTVPVAVQVLGASQIQGLDGELGPTTQLLPGADYEWVFYHEDGAALWGIVSDTAGLAKGLWVDGGLVTTKDASPPNPGDVLTALDDSTAAWLPPGGGAGGLTYIGSSAAPNAGQWCLVDSAELDMPGAAVPGDTVGMFVVPSRDGARLNIPEGQDLWFANQVTDGGTFFTLRGGAYYEWTLQPIGESMRWVPRGMSNERPDPLLRRKAGAMAPNEWVRSSDYSGVVNLPATPPIGTVIGVMVHSDGANIVPATGDTIATFDYDEIVDGPDYITVDGPDYCEWIWWKANDADPVGRWVPRQQLSRLLPDAVLHAIAIAGAPLDMGGQPISNLADPTAAQDAATKAYVLSHGGASLASTAPTQVSVTTAAVGTGTTAARSDHVHSVSTAAPAALAVGSAQAAGTATSVSRSDHVHAMPGVATQAVSGFMAAADKTRLDSMSLAFKAPVRLVSIADLGVILSTGGNTTIDGVLTATGDRVLLTQQTNAWNNGIWIVVSGSGWTRATDTDTTAKFSGGSLVYVNEGTTYKDTLWTLTTNDPIVLGTTSLQIAQIGGQKATALPVDVGKPSVAANNGTAAKWSPEDHSHQAHSLHNGFNGFRVSNNAASSVPTDGSSSTVYLVPHSGYRISLSNNGLDWYPVTPSSNPSVAVTGQTAGIPCDVFAVFGSLTGVTLALLPWTNATTRATALVQTNGVWVKSGVPTQRYVGTILPDSATTFSHVSAASGAANPICGIWNQANRIRGAFTWSAAFDTWTIPSANTWQQINAQASAKVQYVQGQSLDVVRADHIGGVIATPGGIATLGIGVDSLTVPSGLRTPSGGSTNDAGLLTTVQQLTAAGAHNLNALAFSTSTSSVFQGAHGSMQGGITAELWY